MICVLSPESVRILFGDSSLKSTESAVRLRAETVSLLSLVLCQLIKLREGILLRVQSFLCPRKLTVLLSKSMSFFLLAACAAYIPLGLFAIGSINAYRAIKGSIKN